MFHVMLEADFSNWFRGQLRAREWSQADFARRAKLKASTVNAWFHGQRMPDPSSSDLIADVLHIDRDEVLARAGHRPIDPEIPLDDPRTDLIAKVKRVDWSDPERVDQATHMLDLFLKYDRHKRERAKGGGG